jgi:hypothetical protein
MSAPTPELIPQPFANDAGPSFINTIPDTSADPQEADYQSGFKPLTFQPVGSGGKPPLGQDFNGILYAITTHLYALQGGQLQTYRADVAAALTGYKLGALLAMTDGAGYWINLSEGNTTDPDAGGANWAPVFAYGPTAKAVTGGVLALTAPEAAREYLIFTGTLSGNQQIELPARFGHWLVINGCTMGGFTLTVKTAAGTGVSIPAGGAASPTAIYCDSVNVERVFVPSALPTSVTPIPDSIVLRNNLGEAFGVTAALADSSQLLATTAFVNPGSLLNANGYRKNPDGSIEQWGFNSGSGSNRTVTFPIAFPTACDNINCTPRRASGDALGQCPTVIGAPSLTGFTLAPADGTQGTYWTAEGR